MYQIKSSDLLSGQGVAKELTNIEIVKKIADMASESKQHYLLAFFSSVYKIEFAFDKANDTCLYILIEKSHKTDAHNIHVEFTDDILIFEKDIDSITNKFNVDKLHGESILIGDVELYFDENKVDSLYYLPAGSSNALR